MQLYQRAGLDLTEDLQQLDAAPRIAADPEAVEYWSAPGRTTKGVPKVPLGQLGALEWPEFAWLA